MVYLLCITKKAGGGIIKHVDIYTDGACRGNPGPGGWAAILVYNGIEKELVGGEEETTNNRMELMAVIEGLRALKEPCEVSLHSDSKYVLDSIQRGWVYNWMQRGWRKADGKKALNDDLWRILVKEYERHEITLFWVRGHNGHEYNERCDKLATGYADRVSVSIYSKKNGI